MAQYLTLENSAGPQNHQAVAVLDQADHTAYYKCRILGFQHTLYTKGQYKFLKECDIYGSVDFIFGHGLTMFQDCNIYVRVPSNSITVTAQSKDDSQFVSDFSFQNCTVTASLEMTRNRKNIRMYLGWPWRVYSRVLVFMELFLDDVVAAEGWLKWEGVPVNYRLFYAEFNNRGPGADVTKRVNWTGFHVIDKELALNFTVDNFVERSKWFHVIDKELALNFNVDNFVEGSKWFQIIDK